MSDRKHFYSSSSLHKLNPVSKIIGTLIFVLMGIFCFNITTIGILILFILFLIGISKISIHAFSEIIFKTKYLLPIIFLLSLILTFSVFTSLIIIIKLILIVLSISLLTFSSSITEIMYGLEKILKKFKKYNVKPKPWALKIIMTFKLISNFINQTDYVINTQLKRYNYSRKITHLFKWSKNTIQLIIKNTKKKQKQFKRAMDLKAFTLNKERTYYKITAWTILDTLYVSIYIGVLILIILKGVLL